MESSFANLLYGLSIALLPHNLLFGFLGALLGTLIGVLPGIGPIATIAMLMPVTYYLDPVAALIMLSGIYYGAQYGGSTTSILLNMPGESAAVVTCLDGYQMARKGRAGAALAVAALGSFFAGSVAAMVLAIATPPLASIALLFGPAEYFSLMVFGLVAAVVLAQGSVLKAIAMILLGLTLGAVGIDPNSGVQRLTFGLPRLGDGIDFTAIAMGLFAIPEIIRSIEEGGQRHADRMKIGRLWPTLPELRAAAPASVRGTMLGSAIGVIPGGGALLASFGSYVIEKRLAADPSRFGHGAIEGVAGPESANNAAAQTAFIPMITLGIPGNAVMALLIGALMIHGIQVGPNVITQRPDVFWGLIASMWVGNLMLLVINLPMIGLWVRLLSMPYRLLYPIILMLCCIGVYSVNYAIFDIGALIAFGILGDILRRLRFEPAPLMLAFVLGPLMEENFRRALNLSRGDLSIFAATPVSLSMLLLAAALLCVIAVPGLRGWRGRALAE